MLTTHVLNNNIPLGLKIGLTTLWDRFRIKLGAAKDKELYTRVESCCFFIGYPRSGHSIIGSVMDAHPNCLISHRLDSIKYFEEGYSLQEVFYLIKRNSERFGVSNRKLSGYQYKIPNQWQGKFTELKVLGDQEGNFSAKRLGENPELLQKLLDTEKFNIRFIHVIRNPFDNITTWALRTADSLDSRIKKYFELVKNVSVIQEQLAPDQILNIRHEDFVEDPRKWTRAILNFLELEISESFIEDCSSIVYNSPNRSRDKVKWSPALIKQVEKEARQYTFLKGYTFDT